MPDEKIAEITSRNQWLIDELLPWARFDSAGNGLNFFGSIVFSLQHGQEVFDLPESAAIVITSKLAKGLRGKKRNTVVNAIWDRIYANLPHEEQ